MPSDTISGSLLSADSVSEPNLDRIRPIGVWSKNTNGAWAIALRRFLCKKTEAFNVPRRAERSLPMDEKPFESNERRKSDNYNDGPPPS